MDGLLGDFRYEGRGRVTLENCNPKRFWDTIFKIQHSQFSPSLFTTEIRAVDDQNKYGFKQESLKDIHYLIAMNGVLRIESTNPIDYPIVIDRIKEVSVSWDTLTISHESYSLGLTKNYEPFGEVLYASIKLTRSSFNEEQNTYRELSYDGTIAYSECSEHQVSEFSSGFGPVKLSLNYGYSESLRIENQKAIIQYRSPELLVMLSDPLESPEILFDKLEVEFEDLLCLLSFFSREIVYISEIKLLTPIDRGLTFPSPQRKYVFPEVTRENTPLLNINKFEAGELDGVRKRFNKLDSYGVLLRAIPFYCSSLSSRDLASSYFLSHAALEAICKFITLDLKGKKVDGQRVTDPNRVYYALKRLGVHHEIKHMDFWPSLGLKEGLCEAFSMRNDLFHETKITCPKTLNYNRLRLNGLFELVVMRLLEINYNKKGFAFIF